MKERRRLPILPARSLVPNIVTILALAAGMTSIKFALAAKWELAVGAILLAAVFDALDGRVARLMKGTSRFGAELDSLSDVISFGLAPAIVLYLWTLRDLGGLGWMLALVFAVCCALRLARFNVMSEQEDKPSEFFVGVPSPMGAVLALWPMALTFQLEEPVFRLPYLVAPYVAVVAFLMVSQVPTFSLKKVRVKNEYVLPVLILAGLMAASATVYIWGTLSFACLLYLGLIPFSMRLSRSRKAAMQAERAAARQAKTIVTHPLSRDEPRPPLH